MVSTPAQDCSYTYGPFRRILEQLPLKTMLEIGSLHGLDAIEVKRVYGLDRVITIECNPECIEICRRNFAPEPNITLVEVAAWFEDTTIPFYRVTESYDRAGKPTKNLGASSCFQTNDTWPFEKYHQEKIDVPARRLDGVLSGMKVPRIDLICMDAQGAELHALKGLGRYLDGVQAIVTELEIKPMYHGQTLFSDVSAFLESQGFVLRAKHEWAKTAGDFLFVRAAAAAGLQLDAADSLAVAPVTMFTGEDAVTACQVAQRQAVAGRNAAAETIVQTVLEHFPKDFNAIQLLGQIKERRRDFPGAIAAYERAIAISPGHALPFTRRALLKLRLQIGDPTPAQPANPAQRFVTMPSLGLNGRFGNQLLQYGLLRIYAARLAIQALAPDWIGRDLFGYNDPVAGSLAPSGVIDERAVTDVLAGRTNTAQANVEIRGYFCGNPADWSIGKDAFKKLFEPTPKIRSHADNALKKVLKGRRTLVALHLRRGDYGNGQFWIAPSAWYLNWLEQVWSGLDQPVLYLATDDPALAADFAKYQPVTAANLGTPLPGVEFFTDHWVMRHADLLATSNSTFSGTAAMLSKKPAARFVRPDRALTALRAFDPWAEKILID